MNNSFLLINLTKKIFWNSIDILVIIIIFSQFHFNESIARENKGGIGGIAICTFDNHFPLLDILSTWKVFFVNIVLNY